MKNLYIVATPIGNLADITFRAIETLKNADVIIAEDTRRTKILLKHYDIPYKNLVSFHARSTQDTATKIFEKFTKEQNFVYVSDAGTPGISDPGYRLIQEALQQNFQLTPVPGASALVTLVSVAGIPIDKFTFYGFLPHKKGRKTLIESLKDEKKTAVFYESVHRFSKLLQELEAYLGADRTIVVGRELTKMHEEVFRGTVAAALNHFGEDNIKGEFVVMVAPVGFKG